MVVFELNKINPCRAPKYLPFQFILHVLIPNNLYIVHIPDIALNKRIHPTTNWIIENMV